MLLNFVDITDVVFEDFKHVEFTAGNK